MRFLSLVALHALASVVFLQAQLPAPPEPAQPVKIPLGMNLTGIADYQGGFPFKNLMWGARPWLTKNANGQGPFDTQMADKIPLDDQGYPLQIPYQPEGADQPQTVFTIIPNTTEPGEYVVLYDGEGTLGAAMSTEVVSSAPGRLVLKLDSSDKTGYEGLAITSSTKGNHVRNIRILRLNDENADLAANPFRDDFLDYCRQWHALRFMDWAVTNNSFEREWSGRKKTDFYTMVGTGGDAIGRHGPPPSEFRLRFSGGVAIEVMIQLANMVKVDPWFCIPHRATREYKLEFARLVKEKLDPSLKVYVEYSNEVWNWQFQQAHWMLHNKFAGEAIMATGHNAWKNGQVPQEFPFDDGEVARDGGVDHPERTAALFRRCFEPWEEVFSGTDRQRLVRVIGVQHSWFDTVQRTVKWVMAHGGADAVSPAGYFGPNNNVYKRWEEAGASLTADQVIADMVDMVEKDSAPWTRQIGALAREHKLRYIVYEGGQHIQSKGQAELPYLPALKEAQFHPGMIGLYRRLFAVHQEVGCDLFMAFSSISKQGSRWGSWGHQEFYGQPPEQMPKWAALLEANSPKPPR